jgi:hypothetical protein
MLVTAAVLMAAVMLRVAMFMAWAAAAACGAGVHGQGVQGWYVLPGGICRQVTAHTTQVSGGSIVPCRAISGYECSMALTCI